MSKLMIIIYQLRNFMFNFSVLYLALFCPQMNQTQNGNMTCTKGNKFGSLCKLQCNDGYMLSPKDHQGNLCYKKSELIGPTALCIGEHIGYL